jgi:DNA-binding CsgD family transcriptional regulator
VPLASAQHGQLLSAIDGVYAAALDPAQWQPFLTRAAALLGADNAYVSEIHHDSGNLEYVVLRPMDWNEVSVDRYAALMEEDPRMSAFRANPYRPLHCRMVVSEKKLHASRTYIEALRPLGIEYTLVVGIPAEDDETTNFLGFTRGRSAKPFDLKDCEVMSELVPHLARSFAIRRALARKESSASVPTVLPPRHEAREKLIGQLFNLSPSLARVTALLMTGRTVKDIAAEMTIAESTTRQYLKLIFKQTGTKRQLDLIRVVAQRLMQYI